MSQLRHSLLVLAAGATFTTGCYRYDPVTSISPSGTGPIRAELTDGGTANLAASVGPSVVALEGRIVEQNATRFTLAVTGSQTRDRQTREWQGETVQIAFSDVAHFSVRRFDTKRTVITAAGIIGGAAFMAKAFGVSVGGSGGKSRDGTSAPK